MLKRILAFLTVSLLLLAVAFGISYRTPTRFIRLERSTSYLTEPLDAVGHPDYSAYINREYSQGLTRDNNAAVWILQAAGRRSDAFQSMCEQLELDPAIAIDRPLETITDPAFMTRLQKWINERESPIGQAKRPAVAVDDLVSCLASQAWDERPCPPLVGWILDQQQALDLVVEASQKRRCFVPSLAGTATSSDGLRNTSWPELELHRAASAAICARAMWHLSRQNLSDAWQDVLASFRLARLSAQGPTIHHYVVGTTIETISCRAMAALLGSSHMTESLAQQITTDLDALPPFRPLYEIVEEAERLSLLDFIVALSVNDPSAIKEMDDHPNPERMMSQVDCNVCLQMANQWYDRMATVIRQTDVNLRRRQAQDLRSEIDQLSKQAPSAAWRWISRDARSQTVGIAILCAELPAIDVYVGLEDRIQTLWELTRIAAELCRYRQTTGSYPEHLEELQSAGQRTAFVDRFSGQPYHYERRGDGYLLYSVGKNGRDDRGFDISRRMVDGEWLPAGEVAEASSDPKLDRSDLVIRIPVPSIEWSLISECR